MQQGGGNQLLAGRAALHAATRPDAPCLIRCNAQVPTPIDSQATAHFTMVVTDGTLPPQVAPCARMRTRALMIASGGVIDAAQRTQYASTGMHVHAMRSLLDAH